MGGTYREPLLRCEKGDPFIKLWHDYFVYLWRGRTIVDGITEDPAMQQILHLSSVEVLHESGFVWHYDDVPFVKVLEYVTQIQAWVVVGLTQEPGEAGGFNGLEYIRKHVMMFDVLKEDWSASLVIGWEGKDLYDVLNTPLDGDPESEQ